MVKIILNGNENEIDEDITISRLLAKLDIPQPGTAVAINTEIIPHNNFEDHTITEGDCVDILRAIGGG